MVCMHIYSMHIKVVCSIYGIVSIDIYAPGANSSMMNTRFSSKKYPYILNIFFCLYIVVLIKRIMYV